MSDITSFRAIIELWGPENAWGAREAMAADVGASASVVTKWWQRKTIPAEWWSAVLATNKVREAGVTAETLTSFAAREVVEGNTDEVRA